MSQAIPFTIARGTDDETARALLRAARDGGPDVADPFFNGFESAALLFTDQYPLALSVGKELMYKCLRADADAYSQLCKSTGYYWLGLAALTVNDYEAATFFMDAALFEELQQRTDLLENPTPTILFLLLRGEVEKQQAQKFVQYAEAKVNRLIAIYNKVKDLQANTPLTLEDVRRKFLAPAITTYHKWGTASSSFITFTQEWDTRNELLDIRPGNGTSEPFIMHLSKGCALFESLLRFQLTETESKALIGLERVLNYLHSHLAVAPFSDTGRTDLSQVVANLPQGEYDIHVAMDTTVRLRNSILHNLGVDVPLSIQQYQRLFEMVGVSVLHVINKLY